MPGSDKKCRHHAGDGGEAIGVAMPEQTIAHSADRKQADVLSAFLHDVMVAAAKAQATLASPDAADDGASAYRMAVLAGIEPAEYYSVADVARMTHVPLKTIYDHIDKGMLQAVMPRGRAKGYRVRADEIERWLAEGFEASDER